jgi:hypothetical protein
MADERCRVTVVGLHKRADLAIAARAPIAEYVGNLARLCGQEEDANLPAAWTLAVLGRPALAPTASLADSGVTDGQVLYLTDLTVGEYDEPTVLDLDDLVAGAAGEVGGPRWNRATRAAVAITLGACWLVAAVLTAMHGSADGAAAALTAASAGAGLAGLAWVARRNSWPMGPVPRVVLALAAVPCLTAAGWVLGRPDLVPVGASVGAVAGALLALVAAPGAVTLAVQGISFAPVCLAGPLVAAHADRTQVAATVAVAGYAALLMVPWAAAHLASSWPFPTPPASGEEEAQLMVRHARWLVMCWGGVSCGALLVSLLTLAGSADRFAFGLAGVIALAMLCRSGVYRVLAEAAPVVLVAGAALFAVVAGAPRVLPHLPPGSGTASAGVAGALLVAVGMLLAFPAEPDEDAGGRSRLRVVATVLGTFSVPLLLGVYGFFDGMIEIGRHM